ncbi:MAG: PSP1 domain-containing protein [Bacillota bacterium]
MLDIVGVRFKKAGKIYYFNPNKLDIDSGKKVIVETSRGIEFGTVVIPNKKIKKNEIENELKDVIRIATDKDKQKNKDNIKDADKALDICEKKIKKHNLEMKLIDSEYTFERNKLIFYFTADGRVDFRSLVRDLASVFKTRIELRQIGVRDEAKMVNGIGICGRKICCANWKTDFDSITIKNAKDQSLSLNPAKISGICGRLMCCINYEHKTYKKLLKTIPEYNMKVKTPDGKGIIKKTNILKQEVKVRLIDKETNKLSDDLFKYSVDDIEKVKDEKEC